MEDSLLVEWNAESKQWLEKMEGKMDVAQVKELVREVVEYGFQWSGEMVKMEPKNLLESRMLGRVRFYIGL